MYKDTCILVLGPPRSGTSLTAGVLHTLGVRMGLEFGAPGEANPKGFFSDMEFDGLCRQHFGSYFPKEPIPLPPERAEWLKRAVAVRREPNILWGVKEWRLALLLDDFLPIAGDVRVVRLSRDAGRAVASWNKHFTRLQEATVDDYRRADSFIKDGLAGRGLPTLAFDFDELIDGGETSVQRLAEFAGLPVKEAALGFLDADLRRF